MRAPASTCGSAPIRRRAATSSPGAAARGRPGLDVVEIYADEGVSGDARKRPALERALLDAHAGRFQVLVAWSVDRLSRDGATGLLNSWSGSTRPGGVHHGNRSRTSTAPGRSGRGAGAVGHHSPGMEKARLLERLRAVRVRMEAAGKAWGRPRRMSPEQVERAQELREQGRRLPHDRRLDERCRGPPSGESLARVE